MKTASNKKILKKANYTSTLSRLRNKAKEMTLKSALTNEITNTESVITPRRLNFNQLS